MVYTLTGTNSYQLGSFLNKLKSVFVLKYGEDGIETYSGEQLTPEIIVSAIGGVSLFSSNRMVIIRGLNEAKEVADLFFSNLKNVSDDVTIVLIEPSLDKRTVIYKDLKKNTQFTEFDSLGEADLVSWIQSTVKAEGGEINLDVARELFEYCGSDQLRLSNEIQKLVSYDPKITKETIGLLVERNPRDTIFELLELAMGGESERAVNKLMSLEGAHEDPFQIASMLIWQAHILAAVQTAGGMSDSEIAKIHKINPYVVSKTKRLSSRSNITRLRSVVNTIAKLDITLKTNSHDPWRAIEQTLFAL